jgi:phosphatidylethanolamine-binding protein (PEBP) family uncharacterized protein
LLSAGAVLALVLAGCGSTSSGGAGTSTAASGATVAAVSDTHSSKARASGEAVASVAGVPITKAAYKHWTAVTAALSGSKLSGSALKNQVLGFLISSKWVLGEAAATGVHVSSAEAHERLEQLQAKQFHTAAELKNYLASSDETMADLLERTKIELLESKIAARVTAGKTGAAASAALASFRTSFETRWQAKTSCHPGYVMEDCKEYKGPRHPPTSTTNSSSASASSSSHAASSKASVNTSGEVYSSPGKMSISSPAFELNGAIPATYTCQGANISPPLRWQNLPAHTVEMVLFVIDDSSDGSTGGIRWLVAGLTPSTSEIQAGKLPTGALVGANSAGKATFGGICPAKGQTDRIEFVLWALSKHIALSGGFTSSVAEQEYSKSELASAVTYATASRP